MVESVMIIEITWANSKASYKYIPSDKKTVISYQPIKMLNAE